MHERWDFDGSQMCIVTGPNIENATKLIKRAKDIFESKLGLYFQNKETVLELKWCTIEAYPSNHIDSYRALVVHPYQTCRKQRQGNIVGC